MAADAKRTQDVGQPPSAVQNRPGQPRAAVPQPLRPGEDVEIMISTTDPQGKPVAAELSLAMIEQSLLDRFPGNLTAIQDFFQAGRRQAAVRTTSSITFAYNPATQPINPRLLAEEDRLALAAAEDASRRGFSPEVAMGRLTESLRTGVTPRIITQEEEERIFSADADVPFAAAGMAPGRPGPAGLGGVPPGAAGGQPMYSRPRAGGEGSLGADGHGDGADGVFGRTIGAGFGLLAELAGG